MLTVRPILCLSCAQVPREDAPTVYKHVSFQKRVLLWEVVDGEADVVRGHGVVPRQSVGVVSDQYRLVLCRRRVVADVVSVEASQCQRRVQRHVRYRQTRLFRRHVHEQLRQQTPTRELLESANLRQDQISRGIVFSRGDKLKLVHCPCTRGLPSTISSLKITDRSFNYASPRQDDVIKTIITF